MATVYHAGVDLALVGTWSITVVSNPGGTFNASVDESDFSSTKISHTNMSSDESDYIQLAGALQTALQAIHANFSCTFSESTLAYTIANSSVNFDITFSTAARQTLGFSGNDTNKASVTSDVRPYYLIQAQHDGRSVFSGHYEPDAIASQAMSDSGNAVVGLARTASPVFVDWRQQFETRASTFKLQATSAVPWTWQHFFELCRTVHPFAVVDGYEDATYRLRPEGSVFRPEAQTPDFDDQWHVPLMALYRGVYVEPS